MNCFPDPDKHYYMFYKPFGCVTAHRDDLFPVVMDYFPNSITTDSPLWGVLTARQKGF